MRAAECRRAVLILNSYTRWSYDALMDMPVDELMKWLDDINEIYKK